MFLLGACNGCNLFHSTDDKTITTNIQAKLFSDPVLKTRDVRVESRDGVVTLSGTVGTDLERAAVERIASKEDGVKNVENLLSVTQSATPPSENPQTVESVAPSQAAPPPPALAANPPAAKPHHAHPAQNSSDEEKASAELHAYSNSVAPDAGGNPAPAPAPGPVAAPAPAPAAPPQVATAPAAPAPPPPAPSPAPKPQEHLTIPEGTVVTVRMVDGIDSSRNKSGEEFVASLDSPIVVGDRVVASRGSDARVRLADARTAGRVTGQSELKLELIAVVINGVSYPTESGYYQQHGTSRGTRTAETVGGGAILGALLGGIFGHGKGAAIGSVAGAGAGTAVQVSTQGQQVKVPAETKLDFTLKDPITVTMAGSEQ
jgi:hypothetical protein